MSLINPAILYGLALAAIPILLHFLLRAKPKKLMFPALRLIELRRKQNVRRMRLRHIWLLLLRVLVILLIVLAIARPSLPAADYSLSVAEWITLLAILGGAAAVYFGLVTAWKHKRLPNHHLNYRRTVLRGLTTAATAVLILLLVGWPYQRRIAAAIRSPVREVVGNVPVAGVFVFDTSLSMTYQLENQTRLDRSREIALEHIGQLPQGSRIAVADTAGTLPLLFHADLQAARSRIEGLTARPIAHPLNERIRAALSVLEEDRGRTLDVLQSVPVDERTDRYLREIYVFTDMAASGWNLQAARLLQQEIERLDWVSVYLIDVSVDEPANVGVTDLRLSRQSVRVGGELIVDARVSATLPENSPVERTVELFLAGQNGTPVKHGQRTVQLDASAETRAEFRLRGLSAAVTQGMVRMGSADPFDDDDVRYFTVVVEPPPEVLVVAQRQRDADKLVDILAPELAVKAGRAAYRCTFLPAGKLEAFQDLAKFDVVCLVGVDAPSATSWTKLGQFVQQGGGLAVFLSSTNIETAVSYGSQPAQQVLPARPIAYLRFSPPEFLDLDDLSHPVLSKFSEWGTAELASAPIMRYWRVEPGDEATVVTNYTHSPRRPALLARSVGDGRVLLWTTSIHSTEWNGLLETRWSKLALMWEMTDYLAQRGTDLLNYEAGADVVLRMPTGRAVERYFLRKPGLEQIRREVSGDSRFITVPADDADQLGSYEIVAIEPADAGLLAGFSISPPAGESNFARLTEDELDQLFGEERYSVAQDLETLTRSVTHGRIGREVFPALLFLLLLFFVGEHFVANHFYAADQAVHPSAAVPARREAASATG